MDEKLIQMRWESESLLYRTAWKKDTKCRDFTVDWGERFILYTARLEWGSLIVLLSSFAPCVQCPLVSHACFTICVSISFDLVPLGWVYVCMYDVFTPFSDVIQPFSCWTSSLLSSIHHSECLDQSVVIHSAYVSNHVQLPLHNCLNGVLLELQSRDSVKTAEL